jgi:predicted DNA-binding protein (UPF0251 family)
MSRPRLRRRLRHQPTATYFKPQGIPLRMLEEEVLSAEEFEALLLKHVCGMDQEDAASSMNTSQSTFQRILSRAHEAVAMALYHGRALRIEKNEKM